MSAMQSRREGFALAGAVLAMVLVGAIVTGGFYAANQESQVTRSAEFGNMAQYIAETGLEATVGSVTAMVMDTMDVGTSITPATNVSVSFGGRVVGNYTTQLSKLTGELFVVQSTGTVTMAGTTNQATRTVAQVVKLRIADFDNNSAFQVYGNLTMSGGSTIGSTDVTNANWSGCPTASSTPSSVLANPTSVVLETGQSDITGPVTTQTMDSASFNVFGDIGFDEMKLLATNVYAPGATATPGTPSSILLNGTACNTGHISNWGVPTTPTHACYNWFPIVYAQGNLLINSSGAGQGILLVEGNLTVQGGFSFYGVAVVRGTFSTSGQGAHMNGTVVAYGGGNVASLSTGSGSSSVNYSSCAIRRAAAGATALARGVAIRNRSWLDLTAVQNSY